MNLESCEKNIPVIVMLSVFVPIGIIGNLVVILVYGIRFKESTSRVFILSLAIFDLITCVFLPYKFVHLHYGKLFSNLHLVRLELVRVYFKQISMIILPLVSVDRYRRICTPLKKQISPSLAKFLVLGGCVLLAPMTVFWMCVSKSEENPTCRADETISINYLKHDYQKDLWKNIHFAYIALPLFGPLPVVIVMYLLIGCKERHMSRRILLSRKSLSERSVTSSSRTTVDETRNLQTVSRRTCSSFTSQRNPQGSLDDSMESVTKAGGYQENEEVVSDKHRVETLQGRTATSAVRHNEGVKRAVSILTKPDTSYQTKPSRILTECGRSNVQRNDTQASICDSLEEGSGTSEASHEQIHLPSTSSKPTDEEDTHSTEKYSNVGTASRPTDVNVPSEIKGGNRGVKGGHISFSKGPRLPWKRMTLVFLIITVVYIIACLPFLVLLVIVYVDGKLASINDNKFVIMLYSIHYITNVSNCFLYGFFDPRFQRALKSVGKNVCVGMCSERRDT